MVTAILFFLHLKTLLDQPFLLFKQNFLSFHVQFQVSEKTIHENFVRYKLRYLRFCQVLTLVIQDLKQPGNERHASVYEEIGKFLQ